MPKYLRLCTESTEFAIFLDSDAPSEYEKRSWLQKSKGSSIDDDAKFVRETNDYFLDKFVYYMYVKLINHILIQII